MSEQREFTPFDYEPAPRGGTPVTEVDGDGKAAGRQFVSFRWNTRYGPGKSEDSCNIWINQIVVSESSEGALKGKSLIDPTEPLPHGTIASSSPRSLDVSVIVVDAEGTQIEQYTAPYVLVPCSQPSGKPGIEVAQEIWISQVPFNSATTPIEEIMKSGCQPRHCNP